MSGAGLVTKGLVGGSSGTSATLVTTTLPPGFATNPSAPILQHDAHVLVTVPTAINTCLLSVENITDNLRAERSSDLVLPSLYKRAYLVAYVTDEIALVRQ